MAIGGRWWQFSAAFGELPPLGTPVFIGDEEEMVTEWQLSSNTFLFT